MGMVYKRNKSWYIDLYVKGRRVRKKIGTSKKIAELALQDAEVKAARDEYGFAINDITIDKLFAQYLDYSRVNHQPSTTNRYKAVIDHFNEFIRLDSKIVFLSQVKTEIIDKYKVYRKDEYVNPNGSEVKEVMDYTRKGARAHTINFEVGALKTIFNQAIKWDF